MPVAFLAPKFLVLYFFILPALYIHFRGRDRLKLLRQLADHSTVMAPYNALMYLFSAVPARPILDVSDFPELATLRQHWRTIRDEGLQLLDGGHVRAATGHNDLGFNSFFKRGWKRFYLKWYGDALPSAQALCPQTVALVDALPHVNAAMFALLPPGGTLGRHRDPFAGSLRYHLGLATPNSDACRIYIDGQAYSWRDGEDLLFDETYVHYAANETEQPRLILFCDVERPLKTRFMTWFNRLTSRSLVRAASTQNVPTEHVGLLNRIYTATGYVSDILRRLKRANRTLYRGVKYALIIALLYWLVFA